MVFDVTDELSFTNLLRYWMKKIAKYADEDAEIILMGNKIDLINEINVEEEQIEEMTSKYNLKYFHSCAKEATNVDEAFRYLLTRILENNNLREKI